MPFIEKIIELADMPAHAVPAEALTLGRYSLLDWIICGMAARQEPLAVKLRSLAAREAGAPIAAIFGGERVPPRMAALVNGATSHALDYDDTHFAHIGHLSVGIYPAALAVAQECGKPVPEMVTAFVVGAEAAIRIGIALGSQHYNHGFHQTATAGAFGATVAAGRLYGLTAVQMRHAIGLCATRASGLKSQFGTMGKPYNAGIAAANGVECAQLAALGFTSDEDALMGPQGFAPTHSTQIDTAAAWAPPPSHRFLFVDNKYKLHACCHGLHAMIEALSVPAIRAIPFDSVAAVTLRTNPRWLRVCDKKEPRSGLEVKFSYAWLAGMTLRGDATGDDRAYTDAIASDPALSRFAKNVTVNGDDAMSDTQVDGWITLKDATTTPFKHDLFDPVPLDVLQGKLCAKARSIMGDEGARIWALHDGLDARMSDEIGALITADT